MPRAFPNNIDRVRRVGTVGGISFVATQGTLSRVSYVGRIGTIELVGSITIQAYQRRIGTIGHVGSSPYVGTVNRLAGGRVGSLGYLGRVGSLGYVNRIGTVPYVARLGSLGYHNIGTLQARRLGTYQWSNSAAGYKGTVRGPVGSLFVGSWLDIGRYPTKTISVKHTSGGSLFVVNGMVGTTFPRQTGTYSSRRIGAGSFVQVSFTEAFGFTRVLFRHGGATAGGGGVVQGTAWLAFNGQS